MSDEDKGLVQDMAGEAEAQSATAAAEGPAEVAVEAITDSELESVAEVKVPESVVGSPATAGARPAADERIWAALAHASVLLTFILGVSTAGVAVVLAALVPLGIWLAFRDRSRFVAFHALQATVFQVASLLAWVGLLVAGLVILVPAWIVTILLLLILVGLLLLPLTLVLTIVWPGALVALPLATLIYGLYAAVEVYAGRGFRYWWVADWIERRELGRPNR